MDMHEKQTVHKEKKKEKCRRGKAITPMKGLTPSVLKISFYFYRLNVKKISWCSAARLRRNLLR